MRNKTVLVLLLCLCVLVFAGCNTEPKVLYQSESLEVIREGNITTVYDLEANEQYSFCTVRVKRGEGVSEPYTTIDTDTIKIEIIPSGLRVYDRAENKVFTYQRRYLHNKG